jgi:hypothetical protein
MAQDRGHAPDSASKDAAAFAAFSAHPARFRHASPRVLIEWFEEPSQVCQEESCGRIALGLEKPGETEQPP